MFSWRYLPGPGPGTAGFPQACDPAGRFVVLWTVATTFRAQAQDTPQATGKPNTGGSPAARTTNDVCVCRPKTTEDPPASSP